MAGEEFAQLVQAVRQQAEGLPAPGQGADEYSQAIAGIAGQNPSAVGRFGESLVGSLGEVALAPLAAEDQIPLGLEVARGLSTAAQGVGTFIGDRPYSVTAEGYMVFANGVVVNPAGELVTGPWQNDADVEGSNAWIRSIQDKWSDEKFDTWRKRLVNLGYDSYVQGGIATKGGAAQDVLEGLRRYHYMRYANGGKPIRAMPEERGESLRKQVDFKVVKDNVGTWLDAVGFDRDDDVQEFFAQQVLRTATRLMKNKGWTAEQALGGAELRTQEKFAEDPAVKSELRQMEDDEMDETLRGNAISIMQLGAV